MTRSHNILAPRRPWTADEDETLRINFPRFPAFLIAHVLGRGTSGVYQRAHHLGLEKAEGWTKHPLAYLWNGTEDPRSKAMRFRKGQVPPNKGLRRPGWAPGRMAATQFKKGTLNGRAAQLWMPIGSTRIDPDGYMWRKISDDALPNQARFNWRMEHVLLWEEHLGPVPPAHIIVFKNRDRSDIRIDNLACISLRENMRRNSYHNRYPKEIGLAIQARAVLTRAINKRTPRGLHDQRPSQRSRRDYRRAARQGKSDGDRSRQGHL